MSYRGYGLSALFVLFLMLSLINTVSAGERDIQIPGPSGPGLKGELLLADSELYYSRLMLKPDLVELSPTEGMFENAVKLIKSEYLEDIPEDLLQKGCEKELRKLFHAAHIEAIPSFRKGSLASGFIGEVLSFTKGRIEPKLVLYAAIQGLFDSLDDPYSTIMSRSVYKEIKESLQTENFGGIGATIEAIKVPEKQIAFIEVIQGSPAAAAGIKPGDIILEIDGTSVLDLAFDQIEVKMRGADNSQIRLKVRRAKTGKEEELCLTRKKMIIPSVSWAMVEDVGYIRLKSFAVASGLEIDAALKSLQEKGAKVLLLDIRNNGGGIVGASIDVASRFLENGKVLTLIAGRGGKKEEIKVKDSKKAPLPLVLLVNGYSCSASEILSGAFKDSKEITLVGSTTFGKGVGQKVHDLPDGAALKLTTFQFLTPLGSKIHKRGVEPHIVVTMDPSRVGLKNDTQLEKALKVAREKMK
ncbi:MAG: S41 family peptidase [Vulcanimicrobiota bacterium]